MSTSNDMRKYIGYMKGKTPAKPIEEIKEEKKDMSMRDMLGKMRNLKQSPVISRKTQSINENVNTNLATSIDIENEKQKMNSYFTDNNVTIDFEDLKVYPSGVIFGGRFDGQFDFIYKVTPDEKTSGVEIEYLEGFDAQDSENDEVIKKVESYYDIFYKYWRDQLFNE